MMAIPINSQLSLFFLGEESVLFSKQSKQLYGLDRATTVALLRLSDGESREAVAASAGGTVTESESIEHLTALLAGEEPPSPGYREDTICSHHVPPVPANLPCYCLLTTRFVLQGPEEVLQQWLTPYLTALISTDKNSPELLIAIEPDSSGWILYFNDVLQGQSLSTQQLLPLLQDRLRKFAYQRHDYLLAIHAAVVSKGDHTFVFPGQAGSGKSTLSAALLTEGYQLFSDEVAVLDGTTSEVLSLPLGLGVKYGSWPVLKSRYPDLQKQPVHIRRDDRKVRYLLPDTQSLANVDQRTHASHIIFPRYSPDSAGQITSLSPGEALLALTEAGYQVPALNEEKVAMILNWINGLSCYSMSYSSTAEALNSLETILTKRPVQSKEMNHPHHAA